VQTIKKITLSLSEQEVNAVTATLDMVLQTSELTEKQEVLLLELLANIETQANSALTFSQMQESNQH
jgi:hypothetical protein